LGYCRYSPRPGETDSIEVQRAQIEEYCQREGLQLAAFFEDERISGAEHERPGLMRMIDQLRSGNVVVVTRLDRLARDVALSVIIEKWIIDKKASIASIAGEGTWGDTPGDIFVRNILRSVAQLERQLIAERTKNKLAYLKKNGRPIGPKDKVLFGWKVVDGKVVESHEEQQAVRRMVELRQAGFSYSEISARLIADGFKPRKGTAWVPSTISRLLHRGGASKVIIQPPEGDE
jgi:site-specific DNA recombinase